MQIISLPRLNARPRIVAARIRSIDLALYRVEFDLEDGSEALLGDRKGKSLMFRSLQAAREALARLPGVSIELVQQSAYDEMVGQPTRDDNRMSVPLAPVDITVH